MSGFKVCNGELFPDYLACPPPYYTGPYSYPYGNVPYPPGFVYGNYRPGGEEWGGGGGGSSSSGGLSMSAGAVAGIIVVIGFVFIMVCLLALKFGARWADARAARAAAAAGPHGYDGPPGQYMGGRPPGSAHGLDRKLVHLLPVSQYKQLLLQSNPVPPPTHAAPTAGPPKPPPDHGSANQVATAGPAPPSAAGSPDPTDCAVCLSPFEDADLVRVLPACRHTFHLPCIDQWFEAHSSCPLCRITITLEIILHTGDRHHNHPPPSADIDPHHHLISIGSDHHPNPSISPSSNHPPSHNPALSHHHRHYYLLPDQLPDPHMQSDSQASCALLPPSIFRRSLSTGSLIKRNVSVDFLSRADNDQTSSHFTKSLSLVIRS